MTLTLTLSQLADRGWIHPSWIEPLAPAQPELDHVSAFLASEKSAGRGFLPSDQNLLRAFQIPFRDVRVVIVGQDPYPTPGHPVGLSFAIEQGTSPLPRSLSNILKELSSDLGVSDIDPKALLEWQNRGVMLLNRVLSVQPGHAGSHRGHGWEAVTEQALASLNARAVRPLVAILWGNDAQKAASSLGNAQLITSAHPSPLSASRGFFGSRPFSKVNELLAAAGSSPIEWV